jgi:hypothetical protein
MDTPKEDKVEVLSILGENEKSWSIDRYHITVAGSILSVCMVVGGIVWLASGGGGNASKAAPFPTGELQFSDKSVQGANEYRALPYPSVKQSFPLVPGKVSPPAKSPTKAPTPTESPTATATPAPTATTTSPTPTNTPTPTTVTPTPILTVSPSPEITLVPTQ